MNVRHSVYLALSLSAFLPFSLLGCAAGNSGSGSSPTPPTVTAATITSIAPTAAPVGAAATTLTVNGTNFISTSVVQVAGVSEATTYVSATQLQATVPASLLASATLLPVAVLNGSTTSVATPINLEVDNPVPAVSSFNPATFATGSAAVPVVVAGSGFVSTSSVQINGSARPTTYLSGTQLSATLTVADLAAATSLSMKVVNPAPGGGASAASSIAVNNPVPAGLTLTPAVGVVGAAATTITVGGTGFISSSVVNVNGNARATNFVDAAHLTFFLTAPDQAAAATLAITVTNAAPGGGTSPAVSLVVSLPTPTPVISSVSPSQLIISSSPTTLEVVGTGFTTRSVVQWNGTSLVTSYYISGSNVIYLLAAVPASLLTSATTASVTVSSPTANPSTSNAINVSVTNPPPPTITSISPSSAPLGTATAISVSGSGFTSSSTISFNGTALTTTYVNSVNLTATIPAAALSLLGNSSVTVTTPAPGGGTSPAAVFTTYVGIPNNSMVYNPTNGLLYVSVPSSVGPPYGNSVVSVDPATGALGTPIFVGSEPDQLALTADGRYLWVALDGASAARKVDLVAGTAGLQFGFGQNSGVYNNPPTVLAMVALPGATDSVVIQLSDGYSNSFAIYDSGVIRGTTVSGYYSSYYALQANGTRNEIYAAGSGYAVYSYNSSGMTQQTSLSTTTYANSTANEIQVAGGDVFTDLGTVNDAESGALLGTFYLTGSTPADGPTTADTALGKAFVLDNTTTNSLGSYNQIQIFNLSNYTQAGSIPVSVGTGTTTYPYAYASRLNRWGKNGLAFRTSAGVYSLRSNLVQDLSTTLADLGVTLASTGNTTGANTTYTATVLNTGPSAASSVALNVQIPATSLLVSTTTPTGTCSVFNGVTCNLGGLASGSSAVVTLVVTQTTAGSAVLSAQVTASENDPNLANNQASSTITVTGSAYNLAPVISSIAPASVQAGATDTLLTVTGSGFASSSVIQVGGTTLPTNVVSSTKLTATIPAATLTTLGWTPVTVSTPAPGGGTAASVPLSIFTVITIGVNHILYDPYSRKIMASVGSGSSTITGNSIVAITPETATVGTPVNIGSQPTNMALTSDGQILYTIISGSQSVARFNMLTGQPDFTYAVPPNSSFDGGLALRGIAAQPGTENTIALDIASFSGNAIYDFNPTTQTAAIRGQASGPYSGSCIQFLDASDLLAFDTDTSGATFDHYTVTSAGFTYYNYSQYSESTLNDFGCFKLSGGLAFANAGGVANPATVPATQIGVFQGVANGGEFSSEQALAPDTSLQHAFYIANTTGTTTYNEPFDGISTYNQNTFFRDGQVTLNVPTIEGTTATYTAVDLIRWGQDGLALLTSGGHIYLLRGAFVVPQLLNTNTAPVLTSISSSSIAHGAGNTLLTLTGSNFVSGVGVTWNGSYRTTTIIDATHITVAIPATDLASAGTASLVATNPGSTASSSITFTIN